MKAKLGLLIFAVPFLALCGAGYLAYQHDQASRQLVVAVNNHDTPQVEALLRQGADPNVRDWETYRPDVEVPPWYEKYVAKIMRRPPPSVDTYTGPTVLMIAAHSGDNTIVRELLDSGADPAAFGTEIPFPFAPTETQPVSALWTAIEFEHTSTSLLLMERGAPVNTRFDQGITPLLETYQVRARQPKVVIALLNHGADVNAADNDGGTPLHEAAACAEPAIAQLLLGKGARIEARNVFGMTPLMLACTAADRANPVLSLLLASGANVNAHDRYGKSALIFAARERNLSAMTRLLSRGADVNKQCNEGKTALMWVSYARSWENGVHWKTRRAAMQALLLRHGANPNLKDKQGRDAAAYEHEDGPDSPPGPGSSG